MARTQELELNVHTSVGVVRPGDKLVVALDSPISDQDASRAREHLAALLPGVDIVVVPCNGLVVYRR